MKTWLKRLGVLTLGLALLLPNSVFAANLQTQTIWGSKLDGNSNDVLGAFNGTDTSITYNAGNGILVQGAGFGGASKIAISATPVLGATTATRSFSFWIKETTPGALAWVMTQQVAASFHSLADIYVDTSGLVHLFINPTNSGADQMDCHSTGAVTGAAFKHVLITYSGNKACSGVTFYINGSASATIAGTNNMTTSVVTIDEFHLGDRGGAGSPMTGSIDEFTVFNATLSSADATTLYNGGVGIQYPFGFGAQIGTQFLMGWDF